MGNHFELQRMTFDHPQEPEVPGSENQRGGRHWQLTRFDLVAVELDIVSAALVLQTRGNVRVFLLAVQLSTLHRLD